MTSQLSFEEQRAALLEDVAISMENVLQNLNKLNRNLEGIITVGNEFGQVEALWSQFETVMNKNDEGADVKPDATKTNAAET